MVSPRFSPVGFSKGLTPHRFARCSTGRAVSGAALLVMLFFIFDCKRSSFMKSPLARLSTSLTTSFRSTADSGWVTLHEYSNCFNYISAQPMADSPNWASYNAKDETRELMREFGEEVPAPMQAFMRVYEQQEWGPGAGESNVPAFAAKTVCLLTQILPALLDATLVIDMGCGEQQWTPFLRQLLPNLKYIGVDIMPGVVQANREIFGHGESNAEFFLMDMASPLIFRKIRNRSKLWQDTDRVVVLARHVLEHNPWNVSFSFLSELHRSGAAYYIGSTVLPHKVPENMDGLENGGFGGYQPINFHAPPFNFPNGLFSWFESGQSETEGATEMEVWEIAKLPLSYPN